MKLKQGPMAGRAILAVILFATIAAQGQVARDKGRAGSSPAAETSVPVSANAYQDPGPPGPANCQGCFPVTPAGQGPNQEPGLPQAVPERGAAENGLRRVGPPTALPYDLLLRSGPRRSSGRS